MENDQLHNLRHTLAHILAWAVRELYPEAMMAIGPVIENGFYYDFDNLHLSEEDLARIEKKMRGLLIKGGEISRRTVAVAEALAMEEADGHPYKAELIRDLAAAGEIEVSYYQIGDFEDLCKGPHLEKISDIASDGFKLTKLAGAYWRGSEDNKMLTRIYAVAFANKEDLASYLTMMEEAEKRDHRKLGKELDLFMSHEYAPGIPFLLPKGMTVYLQLLQYVREKSYGEGYQEIRTPQLLNAELWKTSGHWEHYQEDMFILHHAEDDNDFGIKPMNCPAHMLVFKRDTRSYRDLPLRLAESTTLYRNEKSGTLHGLTRVRSISQDDTHIFATQQQIFDEILALLGKIKAIYQDFGLLIDEIHLSTRPESFLGERQVWDEAEASLKKALETAGLAYIINEGDGAFYGPKIDVKVKDAIGRQWQLATIQLDYQMPLRFGLSYVDSDGSDKAPVVIHRALLGSLERFMGVIIEHFSGAFPVWLSPVQVKLVAVGRDHVEHCRALAIELKAVGIRVEIDEADETVGNKIRKAVNEKVPYMLVIGDKEIATPELMVRDRGSRDTREISKQAFLAEVAEKIKARSL